jgi:hypothetical protein
MVTVRTDTQYGKSVATKIAARQADSEAARPDAVSIGCRRCPCWPTTTGHVRPGDNLPLPEAGGR